MSRREKKLSKEDADLWRTTTLSCEPLSDRGRVRADGSSDASDEMGGLHDAALFRPGDLAPHPERATGKEGLVRSERNGPRAYSPAPSYPREAPEAEFDPRRAKRIARGQVSIDGRIDLHGMRQEQARRALRSFILASHARDARTVLVITGKGRGGGADEGPWYERSPRGVLRQEVPRWLMSDLGDVVVSYTPAHQRHGGDGALYVQLRSRRRAGGGSR